MRVSQVEDQDLDVLAGWWVRTVAPAGTRADFAGRWRVQNAKATRATCVSGCAQEPGPSSPASRMRSGTRAASPASRKGGLGQHVGQVAETGSDQARGDADVVAFERG